LPPPRGPKQLFLLGTGIRESISPQIFNAVFMKLGMNATYSLLSIDESELDRTVKEIIGSNDAIGFNVTAPFKQKIMEYLSELDPRAEIVGAVNTVKISRGRKLHGFNTDCDGVVATLAQLDLLHGHGLELLAAHGRGRSAIMLGAGGAARAVAYALASNHFSSIVILDRTIENGTAIAYQLKPNFPKLQIEVHPLKEDILAQGVRKCDLLINAISSISGPNFPIKLDLSRAQKGMKVFDLGYKETSPFLRITRDYHLAGANGLLMLVEQAAKSFEIWTGEKAPKRMMMNAARNALKRSRVGLP
jgi:shikimate dehydrogenase